MLFSFKGFLPFSRMTYCAYLIHPVIMVYTSFLLDGPIHLQQGLVVCIVFKSKSSHTTVTLLSDNYLLWKYFGLILMRVFHFVIFWSTCCEYVKSNLWPEIKRWLSIRYVYLYVIELPICKYLYVNEINNKTTLFKYVNLLLRLFINIYINFKQYEYERHLNR